MLTSNEDNRLSLSHPPAPEQVVAQPRKKTKSSSKPSSVALPKSIALQTVEAESKASYVDRAKLRRSYYGSTAPPSIAQKEATPPVQQHQIEPSGIHARSMSMMTPRAGLGSEKLVDEVERAGMAEMDWREKVREKARNRFQAM